MHDKISDIEKILVFLKLWYTYRELHKKKKLILDSCVVFEKVIYRYISLNHCFRVEVRDCSKSSTIDHIRAHNFDKGRDFCDFLEKEFDYFLFFFLYLGAQKRKYAPIHKKEDDNKNSEKRKQCVHENIIFVKDSFANFFLASIIPV